MNETKRRQRADLQRHFKTIGIGDVFRSGLPPHPLPSAYLDRNQNKQLPSTFVSWEIVGDIKVSPEDFVVREIALGGKTIPGWKDDQWETVRVADLTSWNEQANKILQLERAEEGEDGLDQKQKPETSTKGVTRQASDALDLTVLVSDEIVKQLSSLHQTACEALESGETKDGKAPLPNITINLDDKPSTQNCSSAQDRGTLHQAIRNMFPVLLSETKAIKESASSAKQYRIDVTIDKRFEHLIPYLHSPEVDLVGLYGFYKRGYEATKGPGSSSGPGRYNYPSLTDPTCAVLRLRTNLPRSDRKNVHSILHHGSNHLLVSSTTPDYPLSGDIGDAFDSEKPTSAAVIVRWCKSMENRLSRKRKHGQSSGGKNSCRHLFVLKKQRKEHLAAIHTLVEGLKCGQSDIGLAGIKDMNAITYQFCTITGVTRERIQQTRSFFRKRDMEIGEPIGVDWRLERGDLQANRFRITLRNVQRVHVQGRAEYFVPLDAPHLENMVESVSRSGFVNFYGEQRVGMPGVESIAGVRAFDIGRAMLQKDFEKAVDLLMTGRRFIRGNTLESPDILRFREAWKVSGGDPKQSWKALPQGNNLLRERAVLRGLKRYGKDRALDAFRCLHRNERSFFVSAYQSYIWNLMATERLSRLGNGVAAGDLVQARDGTVKFVTENLSAWKIDDVVLPLPGCGVMFPSNVIGDLYQEILTNDKVLFLKDTSDESTAKGSYRRLVVRAENTEWRPWKNAGDENLIPTFSICFDLPKGCYATVFLRELMMTTVDRVDEIVTDDTRARFEN